ncbi:hypothetical protein [Nocardioides sp.]|uniref:hypothetical protein n=1 Tax=Nocardioides sp. TaxID=35761 RepID=UPI003219FDA0
MSTEPMSAVNAVTTTVTDYGPDPRNPAQQILREVFLRLHGWLVPAYVGGDNDPGNQFHGLAAPMQEFKGLANPGSTTVVYRGGDYAQLDSAITAGPMGDPTRRILADRLRRGRS